ncbi:PREDICTED: uncharacterized protein LOC109587158 [Amphimedon queenslandica]|uniref:Death domain-containing protein n=1 Tax=Amphimedon queenslandica TaxID=400682 RepID=A0AAN0JQ70_AMPQE|nr:PREDICTED: uncharacterized protein LOC109587158 [Amphimedon queenslandica]|eukprot:XP_019858953.1 PREDICTED: uncharacterized protein LOC109587158 [Amphimedon queenslandica]
MEVYQPVKRDRHSTVQVGDYLYMWGGRQPDLPLVHDNEKKKSMCSVVEVCHVPTGEWVQKPTIADPPLGVHNYAAAVIRNEIFFFGGDCGHGDCFHNSLYSFNVDTFNWKELWPTTSHHGPMMKSGSSMIAIKVKDEDYLAVIGGFGSSSNNTPPQPGAQYSESYGYQRCNEVHMYRLKTGEWTSPTVTGDRPPPINGLTLTSITNTTAILFGGYDGERWSNDVYVFEFTDTSVKCTKFSNPGESVQWPKERSIHSSVLINCSSGPHILVVGGFGTSDCWLLNINKMEWKELTNIPHSVTDREYHSLSVWSETQTTHWIIEFGGETSISDTRFIEIISSTGDLVVQSVLDINKYQKRRIQDAVGKWMEEGSVDLTVTRVNMLGAPGAGKTCTQLLLLNEDPPIHDTSTPIACPAVRATRVAVCDKTIWNRVTRDKLLDQLETNAKPLLIVWREEESEEILPVPTGLFPLTIVHLLNQKECVTKISPSTPEYYKFRDAMSLKITFEGKEDSLHLINRYTHIEVYFTGPTQHCPLVRKLLTTAIDNSSDAMHLKHNYVNAFACLSKRNRCYCIVRPREGGHIVNCTVCSVSAAISSDHWYWFESGPVENDNKTQIKQVNDQSSDENLQLDEKPQKSDLHRLFTSSAAHYSTIGTALDVDVTDLLHSPMAASDKLILVFQRWIDSNKGVTWRKVLQVCDDYPDQLGRVKADVEGFLSSDSARGGSRRGGPGSARPTQKRWIKSNKGVTWRKVLQVCEDYPEEFGEAKAEVKGFLT